MPITDTHKLIDVVLQPCHIITTSIIVLPRSLVSIGCFSYFQVYTLKGKLEEVSRQLDVERQSFREQLLMNKQAFEEQVRCTEYMERRLAGVHSLEPI